jgi:DNA-binding SARP family transcriptional activator
VDFCILGPLQVLDGGVEVPLGSPKERALLAVLLLHRGAVVSRERLIDGLWGETAPPTAGKALNVHVSQLRKALSRNGGDPIVTRAPGYELRLDPERLDVTRFEQLVVGARERSAAGDPGSASKLFREGLALWRGPALAGIHLESSARDEVVRLEQLRLDAQLDRIDCDLALGRNAGVIGELDGLIREHPLYERLRGQYMLALYRAGRQADALHAYQEARRTLVDELGLEPSEALQRLERAILNHDPSLELPEGVQSAAPQHLERSAPEQHPALDSGPTGALLVQARVGWKWFAAAAGVVVACAVALLLAILASRGNAHVQPRVSVRPNSLALINPRSGRIEADVAVGTRPTRVAVEGGDAWVLNANDRTVSRVDASTHQVRTVSVGGTPADLAVGGGAVWVVQSAADVSVYRIDPTTMATDRIELPGAFPYGLGNPGQAYIAYGAGAVWVTRSANGGGVLWRIDPATGAVRSLVGPNGPIVVGAGAAWVPGGGTLTKVDPHTLSVVSTHDAQFDAPAGPALGAGQLWVPDVANVNNSYTANAGTLWDVDLSSGNVTRVVVGGGAVAAAYGSGDVWVACSLSHAIVRVDPVSEAVVATIHLDGMPSGLAFAKNWLWISVS